MNPRQLIDLQLDSMFGHTMPEKVQALVDADVNTGEWHDGYELAFLTSSLSRVEGEKLMDVVLAQYPALQIDQAQLLQTVERELPQSRYGARVLWIVDESGSYALADSLRVRGLKEAK